MADLKKFEEMLERLVNEDKEGAQELFHEIVVEKSRDIYESLLEDEVEEDEEVEESTDEEVEESTDEEVDEAADEDEDEDEEVKEDFDLDEFEVEADPADDMMSDLEGGDESDDEGDDEGEEGEEELEDRVMDLEDALDDLKAEFEKMMDGEEGGEDDMGDEEGDMDMDDEEPEEESFAFESDKEVEEAADEEVEEAVKSDREQMREYVDKVSATMGDNGDNTKSPTASANNMGGTSANIAKGGEGNKGDHAGLGDLNAKDQDGGNVNVPGGKASKSMKSQPGHGAEKKGAAEKEANKKSPIGS